MHFTPPVRVWRGPRLHHNNHEEFSQFTDAPGGPTCDSYDVLPQVFLTLPADIDEDDWIEFGLMGAYTQASLTPFNGFDLAATSIGSRRSIPARTSSPNKTPLLD